jgi:co-chaperonin GroES (HSP10)
MEFLLNGIEIPRPIEPLDKKILVKIRADVGETKGSGLILARNESTDVRPKLGLVMAVGPGDVDHKSGDLIPPLFKVGDMIWVDKWSGDPVYWQGARHIILDADEVLGSFEGDEVSSTAFRPNGDRVMVQVAIQKEKTTDFGIVIAGTDEEDNNQGVVRGVGPGRYSPLRVSVGESVLFKPYAGLEVELDDMNFRLVEENEILVKWKSADIADD